MKQDRTIQKLILTIKEEDQIPKQYQGFIHKYLNFAYVAGWEEGRKSDNAYLCDKPVAQYDRKGNKIAEYPSVTFAANKLHVTRDGIYKAIRKGTPTKTGYIWKYLTSPQMKDISL